MGKDVWGILRRRFPEKEYALMAEVSDKAGFERSNSADYIAVNLWPSRGLHVNGIELKSHRADWLRELKNPDKASNIIQYCDFFWLLTAGEDVAKLEEIPVTWGWMCIKGERIFLKKEAPKLTPKPLDKHFVCAMLKRAQDKTNFVHRDSIQQEIYVAEENAKSQQQRQINDLIKELQQQKTIIREYHEASGVNIENRSYYGDSTVKIGQAVKFIREGGADSIKKQLLGLEETAQTVIKRISDGLTALKESSTVKAKDKNNM